MSEQLLNWAENYRYQPTKIHRPTAVEQIQEIVRGAEKVKALGSRHSFNSIADTTGDLISFERLDRILDLDRTAKTVTIESGIRYGTLATYLVQEGFALHNLASLPHISVAGACATATHGSGDKNGNLSTAVASLQLIKGNGELVNLSRKDDKLNGAVVGLGALGLVTQLTLDIAPSFQMSQEVYEELDFEVATRHFDEITSSGYSVSLFTGWKEAVFSQVWIKRVQDSSDPGDATEEFFGAKRATGPRHPLPNHETINCTEQMGACGPWHERMPHFRMEFTPSSGEELQSEYLVPRQFATEALHAIFALRTQISPHLHISEIRTVAADNLWMSPCYQQPCVGFHFTWKKDWATVQTLLPIVEAALAPFQARAHWGKLFTHSPVAQLYPRRPEFKALAQAYDPQGKFRNDFLDQHIFHTS